LNNITVTVSSVTYAIKLKKLLARGGIQSNLVKLEDKKGKLGCINGVRISQNDLFASIVIMKKNGIDYSIYE
jgi:hypothetical protein